jgi:hypothetical protein
MGEGKMEAKGRVIEEVNMIKGHHMHILKCHNETHY